MTRKHAYAPKSPVQDIREALEGFESMTDVKNEWHDIINTISQSELAEDRELHAQLSSCRRWNRCVSAACPICFRHYRQWFFAESVNVFNRMPAAKMLTLLLYGDMMTDAELVSFDPTTLKNRLRKQLSRAGFRWPVIGCLELDYHQESRLWHPHFHLIVFETRKTIEELRPLYTQKHRRRATSAQADRPMHVQKVKDSAKAISYVCKRQSSRIESYKVGGLRKTQKFSLKRTQQRLISRTKHRIGFSGLRFLHNCRQEGNRLFVRDH